MGFKLEDSNPQVEKACLEAIFPLIRVCKEEILSLQQDIQGFLSSALPGKIEGDPELHCTVFWAKDAFEKLYLALGSMRRLKGVAEHWAVEERQK